MRKASARAYPLNIELPFMEGLLARGSRREPGVGVLGDAPDGLEPSSGVAARAPRRVAPIPGRSRPSRPGPGPGRVSHLRNKRPCRTSENSSPSEAARKVPEASETWPLGRPLGRLSYAIRPESAPVCRPTRRSERRSHPFSDSLSSSTLAL